MTKSKLGRPVVSPAKQKRYSHNALDFVEDATSSELSKSKPFFFDKEEAVPGESPEPTLYSKNMNPELSQRTNDLSPHSKQRLYFKLAKTMHLFSTQEQ
jgi:hypothetical protein